MRRGSRDVVPAHLRQQLQARADANCPECYGEGVITYTAYNPLGYTEVRCPCVGIADEPPEDRDR